MRVCTIWSRSAPTHWNWPVHKEWPVPAIRSSSPPACPWASREAPTRCGSKRCTDCCHRIWRLRSPRTASPGSPFLIDLSSAATLLPYMPSLKPPRYAIAALNGFSQILLQAHPVCGSLILLAMGLHAPELMIGAMLGVLASTLGAAALGYPQADIDIGLYGYNGALLGLLLMLLLGLSALSLGLIALGAAVSNLLQVRLLTAMRERNWLPGFTLPLILFGWFA